jgi:acyl-CoA dehydrogenase
VVLALIVLSIVAFGVLAMRRAPLWQWAVAALVVGLLTRFAFDASGLWLYTDLLGWILALLPAALLGLFAIRPVRLALLSSPAHRLVKSILPRVSRTEQEALDAGTVGWDAELFSGRPRWNELLKIRKPTLTEEEQAFLDGPVNKLCSMLDDWDIRHNRADLPPEVWAYLKDNGFLGMLISKEHGGLGFSAQAQSQVVSKVASRSVAAGITVMVPNSLGPGELLEKYGTPEQKEKYLHRLAKGQEIPCFALTGPHAGSDAAGMRDVGVVCYDMFNGKKTLGVKLSWDKRYITLAPVATLLGLAFNLHDPEHLLGEQDDLGITLALVPA